MNKFIIELWERVYYAGLENNRIVFSVCKHNAKIFASYEQAKKEVLNIPNEEFKKNDIKHAKILTIKGGK